MITDKRPMPYSLPYGMASSLIGLIVLAYAGHYALLLVGAWPGASRRCDARSARVTL